MTAQDVERLVISQIGDQWDRWTAHGLDLRRCLVRPPRRETYYSQTLEGEIPLSLWLVVEEEPHTHTGYEVFYDPEEDTFGLGSIDVSGKRHYIAGYGSLWDTLEGM